MISQHGETHLDFTPQSDFIIIRNYVLENREQSPFNIITRSGVDERFAERTPGVSDIIGLVHFYTYPTREEFIEKRWDTFYIDVHRDEFKSGLEWIRENRSYLLPLLGKNKQEEINEYSIQKITILSDNEYSYFVRVNLEWSEKQP